MKRNLSNLNRQHVDALAKATARRRRPSNPACPACDDPNCDGPPEQGSEFFRKAKLRRPEDGR